METAIGVNHGRKSGVVHTVNAPRRLRGSNQRVSQPVRVWIREGIPLDGRHVARVASSDVEVQQNGHEHIDRSIPDPAGHEPPLPRRGNGFTVQARVERTRHADRRWNSFAADDDLERDHSLDPLPHGIGRVFRRHLCHQYGSHDAATEAESSPAEPATLPGADSRPGTDSHTRSGSAASSFAVARSTGERKQR